MRLAGASPVFAVKSWTLMLKTMNFALQIMNLCITKHEFCITNDEFCSPNDGICIENAALFIYNDEPCISNEECRAFKMVASPCPAQRPHQQCSRYVWTDYQTDDCPSTERNTPAHLRQSSSFLMKNSSFKMQNSSFWTTLHTHRENVHFHCFSLAEKDLWGCPASVTCVKDARLLRNDWLWCYIIGKLHFHHVGILLHCHYINYSIVTWRRVCWEGKACLLLLQLLGQAHVRDFHLNIIISREITPKT